MKNFPYSKGLMLLAFVFSLLTTKAQNYQFPVVLGPSFVNTEIQDVYLVGTFTQHGAPATASFDVENYGMTVNQNSGWTLAGYGWFYDSISAIAPLQLSATSDSYITVWNEGTTPITNSCILIEATSGIPGERREIAQYQISSIPVGLYTFHIPAFKITYTSPSNFNGWQGQGTGQGALYYECEMAPNPQYPINGTITN